MPSLRAAVLPRLCPRLLSPACPSGLGWPGGAEAAPSSAPCPARLGPSFLLRVTDRSAAGAWPGAEAARRPPRAPPPHPSHQRVALPTPTPTHCLGGRDWGAARPPGTPTERQLQLQPRARPGLLLALDSPPGEPDAPKPAGTAWHRPRSAHEARLWHAPGHATGGWHRLEPLPPPPVSSCSGPQVQLPLPNAPRRDSARRQR